MPGGFAPYPFIKGNKAGWAAMLVGSIFFNIVYLLIFIGIGAFIYSELRSDWREYFAARSSQNWHSAQGQIIESFVYQDKTRKKGGAFEPVIRYAYQVEDIEYKGDRILFAVTKPRFATREEALNELKPFGEIRKETETKDLKEFEKELQAILKTKPQNRRIEVFYDPADRGNSTLRKNYVAADHSYIYFCAIPIFLFISTILLTSVVSWSRSVKNKEYNAVAAAGDKEISKVEYRKRKPRAEF